MKYFTIDKETKKIQIVHSERDKDKNMFIDVLGFEHPNKVRFDFKGVEYLVPKGRTIVLNKYKFRVAKILPAGQVVIALINPAPQLEIQLT